ncbi:hypothetical protein Pla108_40880 [Botrimarina colliarenosi]|uniref:Uncharacterized protein n=1 Tax=Botrimarina colliarenosi TaxID=2528001 RepID=A0A5C5ZXT2_9BACT|nr:hypothetical protein Pla108_40880 [Botrimarina colliarenosi]
MRILFAKQSTLSGKAKPRSRFPYLKPAGLDHTLGVFISQLNVAVDEWLKVDDAHRNVTGEPEPLGRSQGRCVESAAK